MSGVGAQEIRDRLAENAFAFLSQAADELEKAPKDSLIHLCSGLELVMKARLAHEHWSLVADKPGSKSLVEMLSGEFKSVGFQDAVARIEKVVGSTWDLNERTLLVKVANHRNKVVHFYHRDLEGSEESLRAEVAREQCRAWTIFEPLISGAWCAAFPSTAQRFEALSSSFRKNRVYLAVIFELKADVLAAARKAGKEVRKCSTCGFDAMVVDLEPFEVRDSDCAVCGDGYRWVQLECPTCKRLIETVPDDGLLCECGYELSLGEVCSQLGLTENPKWNCWTCGNYSTGSAFRSNAGDRALCMMCMQSMQSLFQECRGCGSDWLGCDDNYLVCCPLCAKDSG